MTKDKVLFLKNKTHNEVVGNFITELIITPDNSPDNYDDMKKISLKEMHYLWLIYLFNNQLPNIMFIATVYSNLQDKLQFKNNKFINATSVYLENIELLSNFWKNNMIKERDDEAEISEICDLYNNLTECTPDSNSFVDENIFIIYLKHFHDIEIKNKYIDGYSCILWNKKEETDEVFTKLRAGIKGGSDTLSFLEKSIDTIYTDYCNLSRVKFQNKIVSKRWFEKYIIQKIPEKYIIRKRILNTYWAL